MNLIAELLSAAWAHATGWTLINSLWQGAVALGVTIVVLRMIPIHRSGLRYAVACSGLLLFILSVVATFAFVSGKERPPHVGITNSPVMFQYAVETTDHAATSQLFPAIQAFVDQYMTLVVLLWAVGCVIFSIRLGAGVLFTYHLRATANPLDDYWEDFVQRAAERMSIRGAVQLAESAKINTPMVIGFFKPLVLVPVGMMSGLSTQELETIFLHELAHIKRNDYLVNFLQTVVETIFFFNPFVWMLSKEIRREREYCCDDIVVQQHGGTMAYARALVQLAEARLATPPFALPLGKDKNQLLHRIKRMLESSITPRSRDKRLLVALLIVSAALISISWMGIGGHGQRLQGSGFQDTVPGKKADGARYFRKSIITIDENGRPHEEIIENFEGDESLRPFIEERLDLPDVSAVPAWPDLSMDLFDNGPGVPMPLDTVPDGAYRMKLQDLERLNEEFERHFEQFFSGPHMDIEKFMEEFQGEFDLDGLSDGIPFDSLRGSRYFGDKESIRRWQEQLEDQLKKLAPPQFPGFDLHSDDSDRYEEVLKDQLRRDGYLSEEEVIETLEWTNDSFKVNGRSIKEEHLKRYKEINQQHLGSVPSGRVE